MKRGGILWIILLFAFVLFRQPVNLLAESAAATGLQSEYTGNAKEFYSTYALGNKKAGTILMGADGNSLDGVFYFCSRGALASSGVKYYTVGYDIGVFGEDDRLLTEISVARTVGEKTYVYNGAYLKMKDSYTDPNYMYDLYALSFDTLQELVSLKIGETKAGAFFAKNASIKLCASAIMVKTVNGVMGGSITKEKKGEVEEKGTVYHLNRKRDMEELQAIFTKSDFDSYHDISVQIQNHLLNIYYQVGVYESNPVGITTDHWGVDAQGYVTKDGRRYKQSVRMLECCKVEPGKEKYQRSGYLFGRDGNDRWLIGSADANVSVSANAVVHPSYLKKAILKKDETITLYACWEPSFYSVVYHDYAGNPVAMQKCVVDWTYNYYTQAQARIDHSKQFNGWAGTFGASRAEVTSLDAFTNLAGTEEIVKLYAVGTSLLGTCMIYDNLTGCIPSGNGAIYYVSGVGYFSEAISTVGKSDSELKDDAKRLTGAIPVPRKAGWDFCGYKYSYGDKEVLLVDAQGNFTDGYACNSFSSTTFSQLFGVWSHILYRISFDMQGGSKGTTEATAYYEEQLPSITIPSKNGWTFMGYNTSADGEGEWWYNKNGGRQISMYPVARDVTLYAIWADTTSPVGTISVNAGANRSDWANGELIAKKGGVTVTFHAFDAASGLKSVRVFRKGSTDDTYREIPSLFRTYPYDRNSPVTSDTFQTLEKENGVHLYKIVVTDYGEKTKVSGVTVKNHTSELQGVGVYVDTVGPYVSNILTEDGTSTVYASDDNIIP